VVDRNYADELGAGYSVDAMGAVKLAMKLSGK